jgi:hypothetical protein
VTKLARDYGINIHTLCDEKNKMKLMEWNCDSGAGPSNRMSMRKSAYKEVHLAFLQ